MFTLLLLADTQKRRLHESREDAVERAVAQPLREHLAEHGAEVGRRGEVARAVELLRGEAGPVGVALAAVPPAAQDEHAAAAPVVGAARGVLLESPAEL